MVRADEDVSIHVAYRHVTKFEREKLHLEVPEHFFGVRTKGGSDRLHFFKSLKEICEGKELDFSGSVDPYPRFRKGADVLFNLQTRSVFPGFAGIESAWCAEFRLFVLPVTTNFGGDSGYGLIHAGKYGG